MTATREALADTSFMVALLDGRDSQHARAVALDKRLRDQGVICLLTDLVVIEATGVLKRRAAERAQPDSAATAVETLLDWLLQGAIEYASQRIPSLASAAANRVREPGSPLSLTDALLVEYMLEAGVSAIASFDKDFDSVEGITRLG